MCKLSMQINYLFWTDRLVCFMVVWLVGILFLAWAVHPNRHHRWSIIIGMRA